MKTKTEITAELKLAQSEGNQSRIAELEKELSNLEPTNNFVENLNIAVKQQIAQNPFNRRKVLTASEVMAFNALPKDSKESFESTPAAYPAESATGKVMSVSHEAALSKNDKPYGLTVLRVKLDSEQPLLLSKPLLDAKGVQITLNGKDQFEIISAGSGDMVKVFKFGSELMDIKVDNAVKITVLNKRVIDITPINGVFKVFTL
jgi:hypothetical protein